VYICQLILQAACTEQILAFYRQRWAKLLLKITVMKHSSMKFFLKSNGNQAFNNDSLKKSNANKVLTVE
jgi:hypothetical protein